MKLRKGEKFLALINGLGVLGFTLYYISIKNFEFLWYIAVMVFFFALILLTLHRSKFNYTILVGLSVWGFMHMAGGGVMVQGDVLYAFPLIPIAGSGDSLILKYDQLVHLIGFGVSTLVVFHLIRPYLNSHVNWMVMFPLIVLAGMGVGALNEIVEYIAVLLFPETGVGGYNNTMIDMVFNTLGAIVAVLIIYFKRWHLIENKS
jgi:uncharacterized membrane protein YjdF